MVVVVPVPGLGAVVVVVGAPNGGFVAGAVWLGGFDAVGTLAGAIGLVAR